MHNEAEDDRRSENAHDHPARPHDEQERGDDREVEDPARHVRVTERLEEDVDDHGPEHRSGLVPTPPRMSIA